MLRQRFHLKVSHVSAAWVLTMIAITGCRFGNHTEESALTDNVSGYYETKPARIEMCAGVLGRLVCGDVTNSTPVPTLIGDVFTNPTWMVVPDPKVHDAYFLPPGTRGPALRTPYSDDGKFALPKTLVDLTQARNDPACARYVELEVQGKYYRSPGPFETQTQYVPIGRLEFTIRVDDLFVPACTDPANCSCVQTMKEFQDCYQEVSKCGGSSPASNTVLQHRAKAIFDAYVNAGLFRADEISGVTALSYTVDYR